MSVSRSQSAGPIVEPLESRQLLHVGHEHLESLFRARFNFQTVATATVPPGYRAEIGRAYGMRSNGLTYGWSAPNEIGAVERDHPDSIDQRFDTFISMGEKTWSVAVPNGTYSVYIAMGDPIVTPAKFGITVEGVPSVSGVPTEANPWLGKTVEVTVSDGVLTIARAVGSKNNKINFVEIAQLTHSGDGPTSRPIAPAELEAEGEDDGSILVSWTDRSTNEDGFQIYRRVSGAETWSRIKVVPEDFTTFLDTAVVEGTTYEYRIRAANSLGASAYTNIASATSDAEDPPPSNTITWTTRASSPIARAEALRAVVNDKLYVLGGFSGNDGPVVRSDVYDPAAPSWTRIADLPARITHAGTATDGEFIYIAGGYVGIGATGYNQQFGSTKAYRYNVATNTWSSLPDLPKAVASGGLVVLNNELHYFGGNNSSRQDIGDHYVLSLANVNAGWGAAASLPSGRSHLGYAAFGGKIYAIAGQFGNDAGLTTQKLVHVWDPASPGAWTRLADIPAAVSHISSSTFVYGDRIIVAGGESANGNPVDNVWAYDPDDNTWVQLTDLPASRFSGVAGVINGAIYFTTGSSQTTTWRGLFV